MEYLFALLLLLVGLAIGWWVGASGARTKVAAMEERIKLHTELEARSKEGFRSLASEVLSQSTEELLKLAEQRLKTAQGDATLELEKRRAAVESLVKPITESLSKMDQTTRKMEAEREGAYQGLRQQLRSLERETRSLGDSSKQLSTALRGSSQARGKWGQLALENVVSLAGMTEHCDFDVEVTLKSGANGARVDLLAVLPGGGRIPVDAKVPLAAYWDALEADDPVVRAKGMLDHASQLKKHIDDLHKRDYSGLLEEGVDFTVLFVPAEPILAAAFEANPDLQEYGLHRRVLIATPVTLVALLRTVGIYWQQQSLADNARQISDHAKELYSRVAMFTEHLGKVGTGLNSAVAAFNRAVGSFEGRVIPAGRRLEALKLTEGLPRKIGSPSILEATPRGLVQSASEDGDEG